MTAILNLKSITCLRQAEVFTDELYVTFNGTKRALPNMTVGDTKILGNEFVYDGEQLLSLFENDGNHWYDRDDYIASHTIAESPGDMTLDFKATSGNARNAHYEMSVGITAGPRMPTTAILRLRSITCLHQAETFTDELYVTFNGTKRSLPNMTQGSTELLNDEFVFGGTPLLSLFENDGDHWYDRDDFIASQTITRTPADLTLDFESNSGNAIDAHYRLNVSIVAVP